MNPLYCFKLEEDYSITRIVIPEYEVRKMGSSSRLMFSWKTPKINKTDSHFSISSDKLDRFVTNKVFTFADDFNKVKEIMTNKLYLDYMEAVIQLDKRAKKREEFLSKNSTEVEI